MDPIVKKTDPPCVAYRKLMAWVDRNSKPKPFHKPPPIDRGQNKFGDEGRMLEISKPLPRRLYISPSKDHTRWEYLLKHPVAESAKNYSASERILDMSKPLKITQKPPEFFKVAKSALSYEPTEHILSLSVPRIPFKKLRPRPNVRPGALKYKLTPHTKKLAVPVVHVAPMKENPYGVIPAALTNNPTKRIRQMAKPRHILTADELKEMEEKHARRKEAYDRRRARKLERKRQEILQRHKQERRSMGI